METALISGVMPAAHHGVDLDGQGGGAHPGHERRDHVVVDGEGEDQERRGQHAGGDLGQGDLEERPPGSRAQVHGRLLEAPVEAGEARLHHHDRVGHGEGHVGEDHGDEAQAQAEGREEQQQRRGEDDLGHHDGQR